VPGSCSCCSCCSERKARASSSFFSLQSIAWNKQYGPWWKMGDALGYLGLYCTRHVGKFLNTLQNLHLALTRDNPPVYLILFGLVVLYSDRLLAQEHLSFSVLDVAQLRILLGRRRIQKWQYSSCIQKQRSGCRC
jgi:hypothetical protein